MNLNQIPLTHRDVIAHIQAMALPISTHSQSDYWVSVDFSGMLLQLHVTVNRRSDLYRSDTPAKKYRVFLPPGTRAEPNSLEQLQAVARDLEALLPGVVAA